MVAQKELPLWEKILRSRLFWVIFPLVPFIIDEFLTLDLIGDIIGQRETIGGVISLLFLALLFYYPIWPLFSIKGINSQLAGVIGNNYYPYGTSVVSVLGWVSFLYFLIRLPLLSRRRLLWLSGLFILLFLFAFKGCVTGATHF